jgi:phosphoethanolamine N-methyltransferase
MVEKYEANVVGIDIEAHLVDRAQHRAKELGLDAQTDFKLVAPGPLTFPDESFDVVLSSGAFTQIENKRGTYEDCRRVLRPGGVLTCYDWMKPEGEYSEDMLYWFKMEGLTYAMETPKRHEEVLEESGFTDIEITDRSTWYRRRAREEYEQLKSGLYSRMVELIGKKETDYFVEDWRALVVVCEKREMLQIYSRARKPV